MLLNKVIDKLNILGDISPKSKVRLLKFRLTGTRPVDSYSHHLHTVLMDLIIYLGLMQIS